MKTTKENINSDIKISILVTFCNQENYVDRAIKSILMQKTNFDIEILIGYDKSTDNTLNKIKHWVNKYPNFIKLFYSDCTDEIKLGGFRSSQNRLNLLNNINGKYFAYLDGDDYYIDSSKIVSQVSILEDKSNSDCIACAHDLNWIFPDGTKKDFYGNSLDEKKITIEEYWEKYYFHTNTILFRKSAFNRMPMNLIKNNFNDSLITFLALLSGNIYYIPKSFCAYDQTTGGIWAGNKAIINNLRNVIICDICNEIKPELSSITNFRFRQSKKELWNDRKLIDISKEDDLYKEIIEKGFYESKLWLLYNMRSKIFSIPLFINNLKLLNYD